MPNRPPRPEGPTLFDAPPTAGSAAQPGEPEDGPADVPRVLSVSALNAGARALVEATYDDLWVEGELSNVRRYRSGHCYFTLKDADAQVRGVLWRHFAQYVFFEPRDGLLVQVHGRASVYEARGEFQVVARSMRLAGEGALQKAFEALKRRLDGEGLFDAARKRPLPPFPATIGVVTSGDGAALHDILSILQRRYPVARVLVCPVQVQGAAAAGEIAEAVAAFCALPADDPLRPSVLIVGRGGGSLEDLWAFNEEGVARALAAATIPVVSAVGHETDYTIADYVADVRAATPSMAAELVTPDARELAAGLRALRSALDDGARRRLTDTRRRLTALTRSYGFRRPADRLRETRATVERLRERLDAAMERRLARARARIAPLTGCLPLLDPARPLAQGYARVERDGRVVHTAGALAPGTVVTLRFGDGARTARIEADA